MKARDAGHKTAEHKAAVAAPAPRHESSADVSGLGWFVGVFCIAVPVLVGWVLIRRVLASGGGSGYREITAEFNGSCAACDQKISAGSRILWKKGERAVHVDCQAARRQLSADAFAEAVDAIARAKGPATRRNALAKGLERLTDPTQRANLMLEASRIEVAAVLDKVDELKTPGAKRRRLEEALQNLRNDGIPDDLQRQQIEWLEAELKKLYASAQ